MNRNTLLALVASVPLVVLSLPIIVFLAANIQRLPADRVWVAAILVALVIGLLAAATKVFTAIRRG